MVEQITVVIVNYNSGEMLTRTIAKVLANTEPAQIIISDNASTDNSLQLIEETYKNHAAISIHRNKKNLGFAAANNAVYDRIKTPFILYLNPDCFIEEDSLQHFLMLMQTDANIGMAGCLVLNQDGSEQQGCRGLTPTPWRVINQLFRLAIFLPKKRFAGYLLSDEPLPQRPIPVELISGACMFVRKKAIDAVGPLDERYFLYCEDYDWFYRFIQHQWKIVFTPITKATHIKHFCTQHIPFKVLFYKGRGMWRYHNKFFKQHSNPLSTLIIRLGIIFRFIILGSLLMLKKTASLSLRK